VGLHRRDLREVCFPVSGLAGPDWPTRREMCSNGTPESESSETKLCRISRGGHGDASSPAAVTMPRNDRRTLCESSSVPFDVPNEIIHGGWVIEPGPMCAEGLDTAPRQCEPTSRLACLRVAGPTD